LRYVKNRRTTINLLFLSLYKKGRKQFGTKKRMELEKQHLKTWKSCKQKNKKEGQKYDESLPSFDSRGLRYIKKCRNKAGDAHTRRLFYEEQRRGFAAMTRELPWLRSGLSNKLFCPPFFLSLPNRLVKEELLTLYSESKTVAASRSIAFQVVPRLSSR